jgi:DNA-binding transcriptional ArsR family regulator
VEVALAQANPENRRPLEDYLQTVAFMARSLADENRLKILLALNQGKKSVSSIVEELNLSQPLVSHHLKELRRSLLVTIERRGPFVYYEISDARIPEILEALKDLATDLLAERKTF